jgi:predicted nucleic acid-binding protein
MIAIDSTFLPLLLSHPARWPDDPATERPIERLQERVDLLIATFQEEKETLVIPTPVVSEFLVLADNDGQKYLDKMQRTPLYSIKNFDLMAAIELAEIRRAIASKLGRNAQRREKKLETKAKISFDRQIVAIAKVHRAHTIYSDDKGVRLFAEGQGIKCVSTWELPLPKDDDQQAFEFSEPAAVDELAATEEGTLRLVESPGSGETIAKAADGGDLSENGS